MSRTFGKFFQRPRGSGISPSESHRRFKGGVTLQTPAASGTEVTTPEPLTIRTVAGLPLALAVFPSLLISHSSGDGRAVRNHPG